jgi:hypothetical protein
MMAVLGAKRPQDRGWQWVVLSLWVVLLVPAAQAWAAPSGDQLRLHPLWLYLVMFLVSLGPLNYLATSWGLNALVVAAAQFHLVVIPTSSGVQSSTIVGPYIGLLIAALLPALSWRFSKSSASAGPLERFSARWRAFRNGWGAFWALRIQNRVNESARLAGWPVKLDWHGFTVVEGHTEAEVDDMVASQIEQSLDSLLRRFEGGSRGMTKSE